MTASINASTTSGVVVTSDTSGSLAIQSNGTTVATASSTGLSISTYTPASSLITSGTAQASTSGTSIDFTGIPSWVKRVTVMFSAVSTTGANAYLIQLGTSGGVQTTGYDGITIVGSNGSANTLAALTNGFPFYVNAASYSMHGSLVLCLINGSTWVAQGILANSTTTGFLTSCAGNKTLGATLDRVRITTNGGTDTFDAGTINILYE